MWICYVCMHWFVFVTDDCNSKMVTFVTLNPQKRVVFKFPKPQHVYHFPKHGDRGVDFSSVNHLLWPVFM